MRFIQFASLLLVLLFIACKDAPERPDPILDPSMETSVTTPPATVPPATTSTAGSVPHYICPDNCVGGGGPSAGNCPICGKAMVHNSAFHNQNQPATTTPPAGNNNTTQITPPPTTEPAQNANGVWHYTCSKGCPGGAGSAVACATCGATLVHNTQYHQ